MKYFPRDCHRQGMNGMMNDFSIHTTTNGDQQLSSLIRSKNKTAIVLKNNTISNWNFISSSGRVHPLTLLANVTASLQTRQFLNVLANITNSANHNHRGIKFVEQRVIGYKPEQVYHVVSNVTDYKHFVPNVKDSAFVNLDKATTSPPDENETYMSTVFLKSPVSVRAESKNVKLFNRLINHWVIAEGPSEDTCRLTFHVDFEFSSRLYQSVANMFFDFLVKNMTDAFEKRLAQVYGKPSQQTKIVYTKTQQC
ncbi:hypothetical protein C9374_011954 [Naegleria lovaniensis]|uniref:Coenzyme Q-binding protein COQ10 START domain-containing protein n=1 Tax=Naegleria lovaniensis TaxID=51637 RepID=A0AA88G8Q9_NAELO|nr:uncharacterized protein C9374_011954 [Naegleria lovaniensis]KAG2373665.1 hypothetical protein C9374_011954 [Naegleria lovaniensis]